MSKAGEVWAGWADSELDWKLPEQLVMISGKKSSWRLWSSSKTQGSILDPILINIFFNNLDDRAAYPQQVYWWHRSGRRVKHDPLDSPEGHAAIQRELNGLEKWTDGNLLKFKKWKALHLDCHHVCWKALTWKTALQESIRCPRGPWLHWF